MRDQISGARLMENLEGAVVEEFEEALEKRRKILDPIFMLIPKTDQTWNGEYGVDKIYAGVPVVIGSKGVEKIEEFQLNKLEKREFENSINAVKELWKAACKIDGDLTK